MQCSPSQTDLETVLQSLTTDRLIFFPIRHHSPACAWQVRSLIRAEQPAAILVEGPADMTALIPYMLHPQTRAPFAVYTTYIDKAKRLGEPPADLPDFGDRRFAGYYPFCDYSPELVALRTGAELGAELRFIDLTFAEQAIASHGHTSQTAQIHALLAETYLKRSAYLQALAAKTGCRDQDELWDHLFEANFFHLSPAQFTQNVAAYCWMARQDSPLEALEADGTTAREQAMATAIHAAQQEISGKLLVLTGGFHSVVLPALVERIDTPASSPHPHPLTLTADEAQTILMRYSFEQLDALNGYTSGMPAPEFYQRLWEQAAPTTAAISEWLVAISHRSRQQTGINALSTADAIAAFDHTCRLAAFRGHQIPTREDLLDGVRSCFVKGGITAEGALLMGLVRDMLTGDRIGMITPEAGIPPIVQDFHRTATRLRLKIDTSLPQSLTLDIYRSAKHRQTSRFLYQLSFLDVPFARMVSGPDFVQGHHLDRIQEVWNYRWLPQTESMVIERSLYGATIEEAAVNYLQQAIAHLEQDGQARSALVVVRLLVSACRMGLHAHTPRLLTLIAAHVVEDSAFLSLVEALNQLLLLWQSREPLEAHRLTQVPELGAIAYQRACYLLPDLANCPAAEMSGVLDGLCAIQEWLQHQDMTRSNQDGEFDPASVAPHRLDPELFYQGLTQLLSSPQGHPVGLGGAAGILYRMGQMEASDLVALAAGFLHSPVAPGVGAGFLRGLMHTCRDVAWNLEELLRAIDAQLTAWSEEEFLQALPEFRLAFADLTPRETDQVAAMVAKLHNSSDLGTIYYQHLTEADLQLGLRLNQRLLQSLERDRLTQWIP